MNNSKKISNQTIERLNEYLEKARALKAIEPERAQADAVERFAEYLTGQGERPEEADLFTVTGDGKAFYETNWEEWEAKCKALYNQYESDIIEAVKYFMLRAIQEGNDAQSEQSEQSLEVTQEKASPRSAAIEKGALMTIGGRIASYSTDDLKDALNAYSIYRLPSSVDRKQAFDDTGKLNALMLQDKPLEGLTQIHTSILMAVVQAVSLAQIDDGDNTISFYLPAICRDLKIDPRTYSNKRTAWQDYADMRFNAVLEMITPFDPLVGRTPDGSFYRVLTFESYDKGSDTMTISTPYLYKLKAIAEQRATEHPQLNRLLHSAVVNEPNRAAVELANRILTGIVTRGVRADYRTYKAEPRVLKKTVTKTGNDGQRTTTTTVYDTDSQTDDTPAPSKTVTYKAKYQTLIDDCPQLKNELDEIINGKGNAEREAEERGASAEEIKQARAKDKKTVPQRVNKKLKDVFTAAFRIIAEKSDAPARYLDFTLPTTTCTVKGKKCKAYDIPTKSTLSRSMVIKHRGRNPQYTE